MATVKDESNAGGFYITKYYGNTKESYLKETGWILRQGYTEVTKIKVMEVITSNLVTLR